MGLNLVILGLILLLPALQCFAAGRTAIETANALEQSKTLQLLEHQELSQATGVTSTAQLEVDIASGHSRAESMVGILKTNELKDLTQKLSVSGKQLVLENPEVQVPVTVIGAGVVLWNGKSFALPSVGDLHLSSHFEGRSRSGSMNMDSPIVNGKLRFESGNGLNVGFNREVHEVDMKAEVLYNFQHQSFKTQISHQIAAN